MSHDWIFDVLTDLRRYALKNGLPRLAAQMETSLHVARAEIALIRTAGSDDDEDGSGSGGAPPVGRRN